MGLKYTQGSFTGGQVSRENFEDSPPGGGSNVEMRFDLAAYNVSLRRSWNMLSKPTGSLVRRGGTEVMATTVQAGKITPFEFSTTQKYLFAWREELVDIYKVDTVTGLVTLVANDIVVPYGLDDLSQLFTLQAGDVCIVLHPNFAPRSIARNSSDDAWIVATISFSNPPQFNFGAGAEAAWSNARGWPTVGVWHGQRLYLAASPSLPATLFGSIVGSYFDFNTAPSGDDDRSIQYTLSSSDVTTINAMYSIRDVLIVFSSSAEWLCAVNPITPNSVSFQKASPHGSLMGIQPLGIDSGSVFVDRRNMLRLVAYDWTQQSFVSKELGLLIPGLIKNPTASAYMHDYLEAQVAAFLNQDNTLVLMSVDFDQRIQGFSVAQLGAGTITSMTSLVDDLFMLVDYNGSKVIVKMIEDVFLDLYTAQTSETPKSEWTVTYLANQTISVMGDGVVFHDVVADGAGNFLLSVPVTQCSAGIPYTSLAETLPPVPVVQGQAMKGHPIRSMCLYVTIRNTGDLWVNGVRQYLRRFPSNLLDHPVSPTGDVIKVPMRGTQREPTILFEARDSLPLEILGYTLEMKVRMPEP